MTCGTGSGNFPQPGDPDLNGSTLSARSLLTGIEVSWTYPVLLPEALAFTRLYRNTGNNFATALLRATVGGNVFLDSEFPADTTTFWYWIQMVSVNGTVGEVIGPVSATLASTVQQVIDLMEARIAESVLDSALRTKIDSIVGLQTGLQAEIAARIYEDGTLSSLLAFVQTDLTAVDTLVASEVVARVNGDSALVASVNIIQAQSNANSASITAESIVRANADSALAGTITTLTATVAGNTSSIVAEQLARTTADDALAATITTLTVTVATNTASISAEAVTRASADSASATLITNLQASTSINAAAIVTEQTARSSADTAIASSVTTLTTTVAGNTASIATTQDVVNGISAQYMVKLDVDGYVSGFGLYNTAGSAAFIIHADDFAIGKPGQTTDYPFIVSTVGGVSKIALNAATFVPDLSVTAAKIDNLAVTTGKINNLAVDTLQIAGNAVTVPSSLTESYGITITSFNTWYEVLNLAVDYGSYAPSGVLVLTTVNLGYSSGSGETIYEVKIMKGGSDFGTIQVSAPSGYALSLVTMAGMAASTGSTTFTVHVRRIFGGTIHSANARSVVILGVRK